MAHVFISFVHEDKTVAEAVQYLLETELKLKDEVFISSDQSQVFAGDIWLDKIKKNLRDARVVVLMLSHRSVRRAWVNFEAGGAWLSDKPIIPCCYGNAKKDALPHPYSAIHALNLPEDAHFLLESLHHHLDLKTPRLTGGRLLETILDIEKQSELTGIAKLANEMANPNPFLRLRDAISGFNETDLTS